MLIFLYGQDTYRSRQELKKIVGEYKEANPDWIDLVRIDADDKEIEIFQALRQTVDTVSMFSQKKLIIIERISEIDSNIQKEIVEFLKSRNIEKNDEINLVFWDEEADNKSELIGHLKSKAKCEEFELLKGAQLRDWIKNYVTTQGGSIDVRAIDKLIEYIGNDLWRLSNEINKLIIYKMEDVRRPTSQVIAVADIELLIKPEIDLNIFNLVDAIGYKNKAKAMTLFNQHLENGEDEFYILSMITYQLRNLIRVKSAESVNALGLHPFVLRKTSQQAKNFTLEELKKIYRQLMTIDFEAKIGKTEIRAALELFLTAL